MASGFNHGQGLSFPYRHRRPFSSLSADCPAVSCKDNSQSQIGESIHIPYLLISMGVAELICLAAALVFRHNCRDYVKQLYHRQRLAKVVLENKWYEAEQVQSDGFFKRSVYLAVQRKKSVIFPKSTTIQKTD